MTRRALFREPEGVLPNVLAIGYAVCGYVAGFWLMAQDRWSLRGGGVLLTAHAMFIAAYLLHEAMHQTLLARVAHNRAIGEVMSFLAGGSYASFDRIRHLHLRHHRERADVSCFDYKGFLRRRPAWVRASVRALEWAYVPAVEILMHLQVILRPLVEPALRRHLPRVGFMLLLRGALLLSLAWFAPSAALLYFFAYGLFLTFLTFFDAFHHTYDQFFVEENAAIPSATRDRDYERQNTYSNVVSMQHAWVNLLTLNFGFHNAHHERMGLAWYRLPALHRELFGDETPRLLPASELLRTFHRNRGRRILDDDYGAVGEGRGRADDFVGAHGVSFLTVV